VPSEARLRANRLNAQKSTGPRTGEDRPHASLNTTRHGLTAQILTLTPEELKALQALIVDFIREASRPHAGSIASRLHGIMKPRNLASREPLDEVGMCHFAAGKEFHPAEFGFVCSSAEAGKIVKRRWVLEHANNAHTWNFDRESCGPAPRLFIAFFICERLY
jgi:hypothetical protein